MPALPAIANVVKVEIIGSYGSTSFANIFHVKYTGSPDPAANLDLLNAVEASYHTRFGPRVSNQVTITEAIATDLTSDTAPRSEIAPSGHAGSLTGTPLPASVSMVISWAIARRYRGGHPRTYLPGQTADSMDGEGLWLGATTAASAAAAADFKADIAGASISGYSAIELGSVSYFTGGVRRVTPIFDAFLVGTCHSRIDSQRRRLGKEHT